MRTFLIPVALALALVGCGSQPSKKPPSAKGGYYLDDGPHAQPPANLDAVPDAVPRAEPLHRFANRTYTVMGNTYTPQTRRRVHVEEGLASWYGRRFHGRKTASGELYDMYAMTAAHPTLPIPSYARVTALGNGRSVVVRINDRGPFHGKRVIDLSYTAAYKLGFIGKGSTRVRVESIDPETADTQGAVLPENVYLQVGAFADAARAAQLRDRLQRALAVDPARVQVVPDGELHRVRLGPYAAVEALDNDRERLRERLALDAVRVRGDR